MASHEEKGAEAASKKQHFGDIYNELTPVAFKTRIMDSLDYICDDYTKSEFERLGLVEFCSGVPGGCKFLDLCCCFGNTTMALVHGMSVMDIKANWADDEACKKVAKPRLFAATVTGVDLSANAVAYGQSAGLFDAGIQCDLNKWTPTQKQEMGAVMAEQDVLCATAALVYLELETCDFLFSKFASKQAPGRVIVNFLNPFELEKADQTKALLLKHFDFVGSRATKHRRLSSFEQKNYGGEDWALLEIWTLARRCPSSQAV